MKWLLTVPDSADPGELRRVLERHGATLNAAQRPVPLDRGEQVVQADGPDDLVDRLKGEPSIVRVNRASNLELY